MKKITKTKIKNFIIFYGFVFTHLILAKNLLLNEDIEFFDCKATTRAPSIADLVRLLDSNYDVSKLKVLGTVEKGKAVVTFLEDDRGNKFCVRQITRITERAEFGFVREVVASYIAESANIPVTSVRIIPKDLWFPGKKFQGRLGTLQMYAPGEIKSDLHLEQRMKSTVPEKEKGLTRNIIRQMASHPDLPLIVAYDTFISNPDRSGNNLFYDETTNCFCGIDLELAFKMPAERRDLGYYACLRILEMILQKVKLNQKELNALQLYTQTLQELYDKNQPAQLYKNLKRIAIQAGYFTNANEVDRKFEGYKDKISRQYASVKILLDLLAVFIKSHGGAVN
ncbi:MAG: hypothetical protein WCD44_04180 [Candidatus Babeliales bacterium]